MWLCVSHEQPLTRSAQPVMQTTEAKKNGARKAALDYHARGRRGKIEVVPTKPCLTQRDLSLAYTPGVAIPCLEIEKNPADARRYTSRGNLVAVVSNGSAVLGLGNIGALAGKPVMEGKGVLFKRFADIDVFDIELDTQEPEEIIQAVKLMAPTFGGINLEDIKAPECFYIEETLKGAIDIPVFHDDQHGTAIISGAALINALELVGKKIEDIRVVMCGAGAAGIACANFYVSLGVSPENILMTDSKGVLWRGRGDEGVNPYKDPYFRDTEARTLADAVNGADVFAGLSKKGLLTPQMVRTMADQPIIFAMANPDPEITYDDAMAARDDCIIATGRSDYPNQVNNVLGFPFIFRGALDVEATAVNEEMKLAAARALAQLTKEEVPQKVKDAYGGSDLQFGPDYIIPKPFDPRVLIWEASAVAEAAIRTGVARKSVDAESYRESLLERIDSSREVMRKVIHMARRDPQRIVFPESNDREIIWAASEVVQERIAKPILLGNRETILSRFEELNHSPEGIRIIDPRDAEKTGAYVEAYYRMRQRKGVSLKRARKDMKSRFIYGLMMVNQGDADGFVAGTTVSYFDVLEPALQIIGPHSDGRLVAGMHLFLYKHQLYCLADCTVNINPDAKDLAAIALHAAAELERLSIKPRIAMLSFSNFGSVRSPETIKVTEAVELVKQERPDLAVDGPVQANTALDPEMLSEYYPFADLKRPNLLVFPTLDAGNISLALMRKFSRGDIIGPLLMGMRRPVQLLARGSDVNNIVNITAIASVDAQKDLDWHARTESILQTA